MSNESENFDSLQKLLKLKRHEVPPPGYFNHFSTKVIARIESEQEKSAAWGGSAWIGKFFALLETNPAAAGMFGISVCGLLISGIAFSQYEPGAGVASNGAAIDLADAGNNITGATWQPATARSESVASSINPMFSTNVPGSLFNSMNQLTATPVSFTQ